MHQERQRKSWFEKNWWWSIPSCCLGCLVLMLGSCALLVGGAWTAVRSSTPYQEALERMRAHPVAVERLGEPIESGWKVQGQFNTTNGQADADFSVPVSGPLGEAVLKAKAHRGSGDWIFETLELEFEDGSFLDLLAPPEI